jgi:N-methylhydantoinase B/oxoprolinase/acetone carboxylase alpha subunit
MSKRFTITEEEKIKIRKLYLIEDSEKKDDRKFCHSGNVKSLEEVVGDDDAEDYVSGIKLRKRGVNGLVDKLELLKVVNNVDSITDNGEHLAFGIMNDLKTFKPYNYFDETKNECRTAMDKIIELYKENEHGEELVKDIEKVMSYRHVSPRAKEFLKHGLNIIRGK